MERQLQHHPGQRHHLQSGGRFSPNTWPDLEISVEMFKDYTTRDNDRVSRDDQNRKPERESIGPLAQTERDDRR